MADYRVRGRIFTVESEDINELMTELEVNKGDAVRAYFEDMGIIEPGSHDEIVEVIPQKVKRKYTKSDKPRKAVERERKIDPDKLTLIQILEKALTDAEITPDPRTNETDLHFKYNEADYSVKLTKHRAKKA
jgi:hypothetical protein